MKIAKILFSCIAVIAMLAGCKEKEVEVGAPSIKVNPAEITLEKDGTEQSVSLTSTRDWSVEGLPEWLTVTPQSGKASPEAQKIAIKGLPNDGSERNVSITFKTNTVSTKLSIVQKGAVEKSYSTIESIRKIGVGNKVPANTLVKGVIVSSIALNNMTSGKNIYVQDKTAGIQIRLKADNKFDFGTEVEMDLSDAVVGEFAKALQVEIPNDKLTMVKAAAPVEPMKVTLADFLAGKFEGQYIEITDPVQVSEKDLQNTFVMAGTDGQDRHTSIEFEDKAGNTFVVFSSKYSTYGKSKVPQGSGILKGIAASNNGIVQIIFGQDSDFAGLTEARFTAAEKPALAISIAELFADNVALGSKVAVKGQVVAVAAKSIVINDGGDMNLLVYLNAAPAVVVGDVVKVEGVKVSYGKDTPALVQVKDPVCEKITEAITAKKQTPKVLDAAAIDAYHNVSSEFVRVVANVFKDGTYTNLDFGGTVKGQFEKTDLDAKFVVGTMVEITGYYTGNNGRFKILPVAVEPSNKPYMSVSTTKLSAPSAAGTVKFNITSNVDWSVSTDNAAFTVAPASGNGNAEVIVTYPENTGDKDVVVNIKVTTNAAEVATKELTVVLTQGTKAADLKAPFTSNVKWTTVTSSYNEKATVNGTMDIPVLKLGTSSKTGTAKLTVPAGTQKVGFYSAAWKGKGAVTLVFSAEGVLATPLTQSVADNSSATGVNPYTLTVANSDYYEIVFPNALAADTEVTVTTEKQGRVILFGVNAIK